MSNPDAQEQAARLWTRGEVERFLRLSTRTIDRRVADGTLPVLRLGGSVRFDPVQVVAALGGRQSN